MNGGNWLVSGVDINQKIIYLAGASSVNAKNINNRVAAGSVKMYLRRYLKLVAQDEVEDLDVRKRALEMLDKLSYRPRGINRNRRWLE